MKGIELYKITLCGSDTIHMETVYAASKDIEDVLQQVREYFKYDDREYIVHAITLLSGDGGRFITDVSGIYADE